MRPDLGLSASPLALNSEQPEQLHSIQSTEILLQKDRFIRVIEFVTPRVAVLYLLAEIGIWALQSAAIAR